MRKGKHTFLFTFTMTNAIYIENNGKQTLVTSTSFILSRSVYNTLSMRDMHDCLCTQHLQEALQFCVHKLQVLVNLVQLWVMLYTGAEAKSDKINLNMPDIW